MYTPVYVGLRRENSAEHSWHLSLLFMAVEKELPRNLDVTRILKMLLLHDIVEIITDDTPLYDTLTKSASGENGASHHCH